MIIPTCELLASHCGSMSIGICTKCGAPISWHSGGSLDIYKDKDETPGEFRRKVHDGFFT